MESRLQFYQRSPDRFEGYTAIWRVALRPHATEVLGYRLQPFLDNQPWSSVNIPATLGQAVAAETVAEQRWREGVTSIRTDNSALNQIIERAEQDIYLLGQTFGESKVLSAGVPWFSTLFGRNSIIAAMQTLIFDPALARQTLTVLAQYQGQQHNDWREEEPGKILHELRFGEMSRSGEVPHTPYYGTVDATPLWLVLYADYYAWKGDRALLEALWPNALAAMDWAANNCLRIVHPTLPASVSYMALNNFKVGQTLLDLEFERSQAATACRVVRKRGNLRVVIEV